MSVSTDRALECEAVVVVSELAHVMRCGGQSLCGSRGVFYRHGGFMAAFCKRCGKPASLMSDFCSECISRPDALKYAAEAYEEQAAGSANQGSAAGSANQTSTVSESGSPVVRRYRDAYRVGAALVGLGNAIKTVGAIIAGIIFLGSLSSGNGPFGGAGLALAGIVLAAVVGILFWVCGVIVAAQGQILRATLDNAVAHSPFLTDYERLDAMGLPRSVADRAVQT